MVVSVNGDDLEDKSKDKVAPSYQFEPGREIENLRRQFKELDSRLSEDRFQAAMTLS